MRKSLLSFALLLGIFFSTSAQWVAIPDTAFGNLLNGNYPQCMQGNSTVGWQMDTTCNDVVTEVDLGCGLCNISSIEGIQYFDNLIGIYFPDNNLTSLPNLPNALEDINCAWNQLTTLPALPNTLTALTCFHNQLISLPTLPASLVGLYCHTNQLSNLPALPNSLMHLSCYDNLLTSLPTLPYALFSLQCFNNQIDTLPALPHSLRSLDCSANQLSYLPDLPNTLTNLWCQNNHITSIPELPDSLNYFYCNDNPDLHCLPQLKKIKNFAFNNTGTLCLPNHPLLCSSSNPPLNIVPLCDVFNTYGCEVYYNISGKIYNDTSLNCVYDAGEETFNNIKVNLYENGVLVNQTTAINIWGDYSFETDLSTYQYSIDTSNLPFDIVCPNSGYLTSVISALDSVDTDMNFGLRCKPGFDLEARSIATPTAFRPANFTQVNISAGDASNFYGAYCATGISGAVNVTINGSAHYTAPANGALTPTVNGNTLIYNIADFGAVDFFHAFNIILQTDTTAVIGDTICITVSVTPTAGDNNPTNNTITICFPVRNAFDPNDKTAYPAGGIDAAQKEITYTVRFQNTGTAGAQHIYIADTLDTDIDEGSFQLLAYSHQPMVQIERNHVRFNFPNINLPDSNTNEPLSHGYVEYKVKLKPNLAIGTQINNTAHIYFDFNAPVVTNTTGNTITTNTSVTEIRRVEPDFKLNPNPARDAFTVSVSESFIGETLIITDITGKQLAAVQLQAVNSKLETSNWASGVYLVRVGNAVKKLVIQKK